MIDSRGIQQHKYFRHGDRSVDYNPVPTGTSSGGTSSEEIEDGEEETEGSAEIETLGGAVSYCPTCASSQHVHEVTPSTVETIADRFSESVADSIQEYSYVCVNVKAHDGARFEAWDEDIKKGE